MKPTILLLVGTSSAGKSTLARYLQDGLPEHYLLIGLDDVFRMVSRRWGGGYGGPLSAQGFRYDREAVLQAQVIRYGPVGMRVLDGMQRAVAAFARAGNHVIVDEMLLDERVLAGWVKHLKGFQTYLIKVTATLQSLEQREQQRGNERGLARGHLKVNDVRYCDFLIDTTEKHPQVCAEEIIHWVTTMPEPTALHQYEEHFRLV